MTEGTHNAYDVSRVRCCVLTISDTRTRSTDKSGQYMLNALLRAGHEITSCEILPDNAHIVGEQVTNLIASDDAEAILITGGTGVAPRDTTYEAIEPLIEKHLDGFGELFRMLSFEQIGAAAMLSRAIAGVRNNTAVFVMPGSTKAVELAMDKLILPQLGHIVGLLNK